MDRKIHLGSEYWIKNTLGLRVGTQKDLETSDPWEMSFGMGLSYKLFQFDFTHTPDKRGLGQTQRYGFTVTFDPSPHLIKIIGVQPKNLYASYYNLN